VKKAGADRRGRVGGGVFICLKIVLMETTVKPVLTATSEQQPPANNSQPKTGKIKFNINFDWKPSKKWPSMYNCHYFGVARMAVVGKFDCTLNLYSFKKQVLTVGTFLTASKSKYWQLRISWQFKKPILNSLDFWLILNQSWFWQF
jgi:hypothetical protein